MKKQWIGIIVVLALVGLWAAKKFFQKEDPKEKVTYSQLKASSYWTCPMHPQIHSDHAGECPICHMKLVQVKSQEVEAQQNNRASIQISQNQTGLLGVQRQQVERMNLVVSIPISGRLLSPTSVAFQVYESDLKYIKSGVSFHGVSTIVEEGQISGVITSVDSIVDPTSRTIRVLGTIKKGQSGLTSETTFSGIVQIELKDRVSIPESAVLHTGSGDLVYLFQEGNELTAQPVKLGLKTEGFYEVLSGLAPGQFISSGPNFLIDSEAKIRATSEPAPGKTKSLNPSCPKDQHWDVPMAMCMPGKDRK